MKRGKQKGRENILVFLRREKNIEKITLKHEKNLAHNFIISLLINYKMLLLYLRGFEFQEKRGIYPLWGAVHGSVTSHEHLSKDSLSPSSSFTHRLCVSSAG